MNSALRISVCLFLTGTFAFAFSSTVAAKTGKDHAIVTNSDNSSVSAPAPVEFRWNEHNKLSWNDFRGPVNAVTDESAAATNCGIGFKTVTGTDGKPKVVVYNTFYTNRSWVRPDAKIASILDHEQGHFDLCELYTRLLRQRMSSFNFDMVDARTALMDIYNQVQNEYEVRQQAYERETTHGTNISVQKQWSASIAQQLAVANN